MKKILSLLLTISMFVSIVGCSGSPGGGGAGGTPSVQEEAPVTLKIGTTKTPEVLSIMYERDAFGRMNYTGICAAAFVDRGASGELQPNIMTSWVISEDNTSLVAEFATDRGILWHDGEALTMEDIMFTFEYDMEVRNLSYIHGLARIEKIDDTHARLYFDSPCAYNFLNAIAMTVFVLPKHIWEGIDNPDKYTGPEAAINCGPYRLASVDRDAQTMYYESVENYWKGDLAADIVSVRTYDSKDALIMALCNGEIDAMYDYSSPVDATKLSSITGVEDLNPGMSDNPGNYQIVFGFNEAPTSDLAFRKAVICALDYELLAVSIGGEEAQVPGAGIVAPPNLGFREDLPQLAQDVERAQQILDEAGYLDVDGDGYREMPDGSPMDVLVTPNSAQTTSIYPRLAEIVSQNLAAVGIKTTIDTEHLVSSDALREFIYSGTYEIYLGATTSGKAAHGTAFFYFVQEDNGTHWGTCTIPEVLETYRGLKTASDEAAYVETLERLQEQAMEYAIGAALCWDKCYFPYRTDRFEGWSNFPGWGVIHHDTWCSISVK